MTNTIILGHALTELPKLPAESVSCVTTSPPYWGLRDYGIEPVIWDEKECKHEFSISSQSPIRHKLGETNPGKEAWYKDKGGIGNPNIEREHEWGIDIPCKKESHHGEGKSTLRNGNVSPNEKWNSGIKGKKAGSNFCRKCNAWRGSLGLEPTFELYIKHLCDIFDEVKRVLRKDGTCFVNIGDSYGGSGNASGHTENTKNLGYKTSEMGATKGNQKTTRKYAKSLLDIPYRFSIEMINRGWIKRNTIIWYKPNCMPSSANDRFTVDFEYVFFFVKSKKYWFEQQFEEHMTQEDRPNGIIRNRIFNYDSKLNKLRGFKTKKIEEEIQGPQYHGKDINYGKQGRNKRAVWTIPTQPFPEAHFAVYPEKLIEPMIKAGCPKFVCKKCGKARVKITKREKAPVEVFTNKNTSKESFTGSYIEGEMRGQGQKLQNWRENHPDKFIGYTNCGCNAGWEGGIVLDPFMGAGTTALVALKQKKRFIGIEIKQGYIDMSNKRIAKVQQEIF